MAKLLASISIVKSLLKSCGTSTKEASSTQVGDKLGKVHVYEEGTCVPRICDLIKYPQVGP